MLVESLTVVVAAGPLHASGAVNLGYLGAGQGGSHFQLLVRVSSFEESLVCGFQKALVVLEVGGGLLRVAAGCVTLHHLVLHGGGHADRVDSVGVVEEAVATGVRLHVLPSVASPSAGHKVHGAFAVGLFVELVLGRLGHALESIGLHGVAVSRASFAGFH